MSIIHNGTKLCLDLNLRLSSSSNQCRAALPHWGWLVPRCSCCAHLSQGHQIYSPLVLVHENLQGTEMASNTITGPVPFPPRSDKPSRISLCHYRAYLAWICHCSISSKMCTDDFTAALTSAFVHSHSRLPFPFALHFSSLCSKHRWPLLTAAASRWPFHSTSLLPARQQWFICSCWWAGGTWTQGWARLECDK